MTVDEMRRELDRRYGVYDGNAAGARGVGKRTAASEYWQGKANGVLEALQLMDQVIADSGRLL